MSNVTISPNMNLIVPDVAVDPGPDWASNLNASLSIIDGHNHTFGNGVQIPPAGLNINTDLTFQNNNATNVKTVRFFPQASPIAASAPNLGALYEAGAGGDLYYNDGLGNQVRITQSGSVTGSSGTITGLPSGTASASYSAVSGTFVFQQATNTAANMDIGTLILRYPGSYPTPAGNYIALEVPSTISSGYAITLPALPASQQILTIDAAGTMSPQPVSFLADGVTINQVGSTLSVKNGYIAYDFTLNGRISQSLVSNAIDGFRMFNYNAQIVNVWAWIGNVGTSGTTTLDIQVATSPGGSFTSIFSVKPSFTTSAINNAYVDANGVVAPGTGVTAPIISAGTITAGSQMQMFLNSAQIDSIACGIIIQFKQA